MNAAAGEELLQMLQMFFCGWLVMLTSHEKQALMSVGCFRRSHKTVIDFLFCILWALLLWLIILAVSGGKVRYYLVYSLAGGILMYQILFRHIFEKPCCALARIVLFLGRGGCCILQFPYNIIRRLFRLWIAPCSVLFKNLQKRRQESVREEQNIKENENYF